MHIVEVKGEDVEGKDEGKSFVKDFSCGKESIIVSDVKKILIGAGARALFYPTLLYNVLRNKLEAEFRWWDKIDEFILLGAVPFPADVPRLKELGVGAVVTLNEPYETLVPKSLYHKTHRVKESPTFTASWPWTQHHDCDLQPDEI